jgi:hypothetical protein
VADFWNPTGRAVGVARQLVRSPGVNAARRLTVELVLEPVWSVLVNEADEVGF